MWKILLSVAVVVGAAVSIFSLSHVSAASYDVSASVPFPVASQPASVDSSLPGVSRTQDVMEIFGTCQNLFPVSVVSVWRDNVLLGSVNCEANGTFRLSVILARGENILVVRTSNLSNVYGPDSSTFVITYAPPADTTTPSGSSSAGGISPVIIYNSDLTIATLNTFEILNDSNTVTIQIGVDGGTSPYTITLNWGDGTTESLAVATPGTYSFKHTYVSQGVYKAVATVTDVLGVSKMHQFIITAASPSSHEPEGGSKADNGESTETGPQKYLLLTGIILFLLVILLILLTSFWLGRKYENNHTVASKKSPRKGKVTGGKK